MMLFCLSLGAAFLTSCEGDDDNDKISQSSMTMYSSGGTFSINTQIDWSATSSCSWITILNASGKKGEPVRVEIAPNKTGAERKGVINVKNGNNASSANIEIIQQPVMNGNENGHEYVDLGTSVFWAKECVNTNASRANSNNNFTKEEALKLAKEWGGTWRIPTVKEYKELLELCGKGSNDTERFIAPNGEYINLTTWAVVDINIDGGYGTNPGGGVNGGTVVKPKSWEIIGGWCWTNESKKELALFDKKALDIFAPEKNDFSAPLYFVLDRKN